MEGWERIMLVRGARLIGLLAFVASPVFSAPPTNQPAQDPSPDAKAALGPKPFISYFKPMPAARLSESVWGAAEVGRRDPLNGLEDATLAKWNYWDGQILQGSDGKYRMFASRWGQALGHMAWGQSLAVSAISNSLYGPYRDTGLIWPKNEGGKGHNVIALKLPDGRYAVVVSETRNGDVFVSKSIDGPWQKLGSISVDQSAFTSVKTPGDLPSSAPKAPWKASNVSLIARPNGRFEIIQRSGQILISNTGILGPYKVMGDSIYRGVSGIPQTDMRAYEDPVIWYSGGWYHVIVNHWRSRRAYHLISRDGIAGWRFQGMAYEPNAKFIRYADGTNNTWNKLERPAVVIEDGHVIAMTFAVIDTSKESQTGNNGHGSKVIVVPFDGASMDHDLIDLR
jgi:hypothetical protein